MVESLAELVIGVLQVMLECGPRWMRVGCAWLLASSVIALLLLVLVVVPWK